MCGVRNEYGCVIEVGVVQRNLVRWKKQMTPRQAKYISGSYCTRYKE